MSKDRFLTDFDRILDILFSIELQDRATEKNKEKIDFDKEKPE